MGNVINFHQLRMMNMNLLKKSVNGVDKATFNLFARSENIKYESKTVNSIRVKPATERTF